jgi:hypothetical protein
MRSGAEWEREKKIITTFSSSRVYSKQIIAALPRFSYMHTSLSTSAELARKIGQFKSILAQ